MANKTMHHVVIGENTYEIVDQYAREHGGATIDSSLSATSTNPVQNKAIYAAAENLKEQIYNSYPTGTAGPASIAVIDDGADNIPVKSLEVGIEPAQSFNGYDKPWAGGTGKNLLTPTAPAGTVNGITYTVNSDGSIKASGTATAQAVRNFFNNVTPASVGLADGKYILSGCPAGGSNDKYALRVVTTKASGSTTVSDYGSGATFTIDSSVTAIRVYLYVGNGQTVNNIVFYPMIRKASETDATYEPYFNICPITGWSAVKVARTGKNLLPVTAVTTTLYGVTFTVDDRGAVTAVGTSTSGNKSVLDYGHVHLRPGTYVLSGCPAGGADETYRLRLGIGSYAGEALTVERGGGREFTITEPMDLYARIYVQPAAGAVNQTWLPMIRLADDSSTWEPSEADTHTITLPSTVYGGTLDVTKGVLTVDRGFVTWNGSEDWTLSGGKKVRCNIYALQNLIKRPASASEVLEGLQASYLTAQTDNATYQGTVGISCQTNGVVGITLTGKAITVDATKAYLAEHPLQVVYPFATPKTYTLTPTEVKTLLGENRIYADAGQVTVKYRADLKKKIDILWDAYVSGTT